MVRIEAVAHRAIAHVQQHLANDKRVHFKIKAWEIQKDIAAGRLHETYIKVWLLAA